MSHPAFAVVFNWPTVTVDAVEFKLVDENEYTGVTFTTATGYCVRAGYKSSPFNQARRFVQGPYAIIDLKGNVTSKLPVQPLVV